MENVCHIGVHPYSPGYRLTVDGKAYSYDRQPRFVKAREERLRSPGANQVLLLEHNLLEPTITQYQLDSAEWLIIPTMESNPTPLGMSFAELSQLILRKKPADCYKFWGAELHFLKGLAIEGCLLKAYRDLALPNKVVQLDGCWVEIATWDMVLVALLRRPKTIVDLSLELAKPKNPQLTRLIANRYLD